MLAIVEGGVYASVIEGGVYICGVRGLNVQLWRAESMSV